MSGGTDTGQYREDSVRRYEWIFGHDFLSAGGIEAMKDLLALSPVSRGMRVLDVGSGLGGAAFYLNTVHGAKVCGVDVLDAMVSQATTRAVSRGLHDVRFECGDILTIDLAEKDFDVVWSRDAFLHISDKASLFSRLFNLMQPGGTLIFTDYGRGRVKGNREFEEYAAGSNYSLLSREEYREAVSNAGFTDVTALDETVRFAGYVNGELQRLRSGVDANAEQLAEPDRNYLIDRWLLKLRCCDSGDMKWYMVKATRP